MTYAQAVILLVVFSTAAVLADSICVVEFSSYSTKGSSQAVREQAASAQPKLLRISATVDGSGRIVFTREMARYEHRQWSRPANVIFDGERWSQIDRPPAPWRDYADRLNLSKAWIVERKGRDVIALEHTPNGFDLYLCDSPNGSSEYTVTIAIPRREE